MARNRTPSNVLEMRGAYKKDPQRRRKEEPEPVGDVGPPPDYFKPAQVAAWNDIVNGCHTGTFCLADSLAVEIAAVLLANFRDDPAEMPAAKLARLDSLLARFGMTPADRSKVTVPKNARANPFAQFIKDKRHDS